MALDLDKFGPVNINYKKKLKADLDGIKNAILRNVDENIRHFEGKESNIHSPWYKEMESGFAVCLIQGMNPVKIFGKNKSHWLGILKKNEVVPAFQELKIRIHAGAYDKEIGDAWIKSNKNDQHKEK